MNGDALVYLVLGLILLFLNSMAILLYNKNKVSLWLSGLIICILGPILAFIVGAAFVKYNHSQGGSADGAQLAAAFIGLVIVGNGIIYLIIGIISKINRFLKQKNINQ
ncbi:ABC transporter permease [Anoxybacillus sp. J5B_2022]|jgi:putative flippase GtrA|uniref:ABC transporter permease n=1 Tax=Anoxybacillus sp. J5B_2022 TaxID=3003246 RepID=UPI0022855801|nr:MULTISPECIES: ABC transporter permease [unclassified Anoxybacillus]MCL6586805.1 ABC transporter permease [Anoxybacillus sp.]MCZ0757164.1 ABC transporter permease [Anoxybacillus sp. J5B_2022]